MYLPIFVVYNVHALSIFKFFFFFKRYLSLSVDSRQFELYIRDKIVFELRISSYQISGRDRFERNENRNSSFREF